MSSEREAKLQEALAKIQKRWGVKAVRRLGKQALPAPTISTGFAALDRALGGGANVANSVGGVPRGRISELIGAPTSGMATLALKIVAAAQVERGVAVYLDADQTFDPYYAHCCGVKLSQLFLVRGANQRQAIEMLPDFIANGGLDVLVFDLPRQLATEPALMSRLATNLGRIIAPLSQSGCALLFLTTLPLYSGSPNTGAWEAAYPPHATLPHYATMRLLVQKRRWLYHRRDVAGYETQVLVVKNKLAAPGQQVSIAIELFE